ncbi:MAG: hypothetical protein RL701_1676 [Pseudomonadota bacterium]|jgi:hypothetical protein
MLARDKPLIPMRECLQLVAACPQPVALAARSKPVRRAHYRSTKRGQVAPQPDVRVWLGVLLAAAAQRAQGPEQALRAWAA